MGRSLLERAAAGKAQPAVILDGLPVPVRVRRSARARRLSLKIENGTGEAVLVLPRRVSLADGAAFARSHSEWLAERLAALPARIALVEGAFLPLRDVPHLLRHVPGQRGVKVADGVISAGGPPERLGARVLAWLKREAASELGARSRDHAARVERKVTRVAVRDPRTRWGSCNSKGNLSFSWRLILAPPAVLSYVSAHEVAHLVRADHSPAFWEVVARLDPGHRLARLWLRRHGASLHRYR